MVDGRMKKKLSYIKTLDQFGCYRILKMLDLQFKTRISLRAKEYFNAGSRKAYRQARIGEFIEGWF